MITIKEILDSTNFEDIALKLAFYYDVEDIEKYTSRGLCDIMRKNMN